MEIRRLVPGIALLGVAAVLAQAAADATGLNHLLLAIAIGFVLSNAIGVPSVLVPGVETYKLWLGAGIVLMGASITLETVVEAGVPVVGLVVGVTTATILAVDRLASRVFGLADRFGSLLAVGAGICGVSAIVATASAIRAREEEIVYAAATVLLFDAVTIVVYPIVGNALDLSPIVFGIWAGVSMFSTGPVVAVGFAHSELAGQWATITKLSRNALIGLVVVAYASYYARRSGSTSRGISIRRLWAEFPKFVLGFVALMVLASAGVFSPDQQTSIRNAYNWLFLVAFVGLGTDIRIAELRRAGATPVLAVLLVFVTMSALSLALLLLLF